MAASADRYRFQSPESSKPIHLWHPFLSPHSRGHSDRKPHQIRPFFVKVGLNSKAKGSAYIETGNHKVLCTVHGPNPFRKDFVYDGRGRLNVDVRYAPGALPTRRLNPGKDVEAPMLSRQLHQAISPAVILESFSKSVVDICVTILECDAPFRDISCGITATSVALADAGIELRGLVIGTCVMYKQPISHENRLIDPTWCESLSCNSQISCSIIPALGSITAIKVEGNLSKDEVKSATDELVSSAEAIHGILRECLVKSYSGSSNPRKALKGI